MKPLFGGFLVSVLYNRSSAVSWLAYYTTALRRFSCLWGLLMAVKNRQNVKSEVKE